MQEKDDIEKKLQQFSSLELSIEKTQKEISLLEKQCKILAKDLSDKEIENHVGSEGRISIIIWGYSEMTDC
jgi:hypothetical protein